MLRSWFVGREVVVDGGWGWGFRSVEKGVGGQLLDLFPCLLSHNRSEGLNASKEMGARESSEASMFAWVELEALLGCSIV